MDIRLWAEAGFWEELSSEFDPSQFLSMLSDSQIHINKAGQDIPFYFFQR